MSETLAVVPIFVNAGTAIIPAIIAPLVSAVALLFKPAEMVRLFRRRPIVPVVLVAIGVVIYWAVASATAKPPTDTKPKTDWAKVAREMIRNKGTVVVAPQSRPAQLQENAVVFRHDLSRCGYGGGGSPLGLRAAWAFNPDGAMMLSSPAVVGGRVYGASATIDFAGSIGSIYCLDFDSGSRPVWQTTKLDDKELKPFFSSPAITADGKNLLIGQGLHDDADGNLLCLEAETGKIRWRIQTPLHIEGSPAVRGDLVVAGAGAIEGPDHKPKGDIGFVLAARISDGKVLWRYPLNDPESSPAISANGIVYIGSGYQGNAVVALRSETDEELKAKGLDRLLWKMNVPYPVTGAVTLADGLVIVGGGNGDYVYGDPNPAGLMLALDAKTGQVKWQAKMPDAVLGAVAARDGKVICPVRNGQVIALKLTDGTKLWEQRISSSAPVLAAPAFTGKYVYAVARDGYLAVLNAENGSVMERIDVNSKDTAGTQGLSVSSPTVAGGRVFVGSETGGLRCFVGGRMEP